MRTTLNIDQELMEKAQARVHAPSKTALIEMALRALLRQEAEKRLIEAGGSMPGFKTPVRR